MLEQPTDATKLY